VVNTEWGSFDNAMKVLPDSVFDRQLDKESVNPGIQMFEKRVSGMFLGEILRLAILGLKKDAGLFSTAEISDSAPLNTAWSVDTSVLSYIEADNSAELAESKSVLEDQLGVPATAISTEEVKAIKILVHAIGKRSARLSAVPIAAILLATGKLQPSVTTEVPIRLSLFAQVVEAFKSVFTGSLLPAAFSTLSPVKSDKDKTQTGDEQEAIDIGVDGSVAEFYPGFEKYVREALREVPEVGSNGEERIRMGIAKDGSGVGAALIALVAAKAEGITQDADASYFAETS